MSVDIRIGPFIPPDIAVDSEGEEYRQHLSRVGEAIARHLQAACGLEWDPREADKGARTAVRSLGSASVIHHLRAIACELDGIVSEDEALLSPDCHFHHLINHTDGLGYYLPVDFEQPFWLLFWPDREQVEWLPPPLPKEPPSFVGRILRLLNRAGEESEPDDVVSVGSSTRLLAELEHMAQALGEDDVRLGHGFECLVEAATLSVEWGLPMELC